MQRSGVKDLGYGLGICFVRSPSRRAGIRLRLRMTEFHRTEFFLIRIRLACGRHGLGLQKTSVDASDDRHKTRDVVEVKR